MSRIKNFIRNINYLTKHSLWDQREKDIVYLTNKILDDGLYEYGIEFSGKKKLSILSAEESFRLLKEHPKSFVRTGDGECKIMMGMDQPFQKYDKELADRLINLLEVPRDNLYVGINRNYFIPLLGRENSDFYRRWAYEFRMFYGQHCATDTDYLDATFTSYKSCSGNEEKTRGYVHEWLNLFSGKDIAVVCGEGILDKLQYDVFQNAKTKCMINGPRINAWDKHKELTKEIKATVSKDQIIVFILGMAGKAMIPELTDMGYMCWDAGHLAKYYDAYMNNMKWTKENIEKFYAPD